MPSFSEYLQSVQFFKKYVANNSYFCINISYVQRNSLYQQFGIENESHNASQSNQEIAQFLKTNKVSTDTLFHLYDESRREILILLNFAFSRFKTSDKGHEYIQQKQA
eukprot:UN06322